MNGAKNGTARLSIAEAAQLAGVSISRIREYRRRGSLVPADGERQGVTRSSLEKLIEARSAAGRRQAPRKKKAHLRLVVDNT